MDLKALQLTGLGPSLARNDGDQVSHGLNLVLKLRSRAQMPVLLAKIRQAQRKINTGLAELNFVHFARFLPTSDSTALQVLTEFDGPLAPYVVDFAIEIGEVFDLLLSFTEGTEHIVPIAEHPAEFLAFVEEHNTVAVLPGVRVAQWPLYSAYPEKSLLDIIGPRSDLPVSKPDRWATAVARDDVQGNILKGYGARRVKHFVLRVLDPRKARAWFAGKATPDHRMLDGVPQVTSFQLWQDGIKPNLMLNIGFTYAGMEALGIRASWREPFPQAFRQGALARAHDNFDIGSNAPEHWRLGGPGQDIHAMVSLYHAGEADADFENAVTALTRSLAHSGLDVLATHDAADNRGVNWFGYADGIANPRLATSCPVRGDSQDLQPAATAGEFVLGADYKNIFGGTSLGALPAALATNGSFCAIRVLAQDTKSFDATLEAEAARLNVASDWLAAKLMGRWYQGAPLSLYPDAAPTSPADNDVNKFDYAPSYEYPDTPVDHVGERCPVGAHIRRCNPRTARVVGARYARRLMRRGMYYEIKDELGQRAEVGLFGMFYCADLDQQFEFIQRQWINGDRFAAGLSGTRDPFVGTPRHQSHDFVIPLPSGSSLKVRLPQFVYTKGSLYLFMPGLQALRQLERFATDDPVVRAPQPLAAVPSTQTNTMISLLPSMHAALQATDAQITEGELLEIASASLGHPQDKTAAEGTTLQNFRFDPRRRDFQIRPWPVYAEFRAREPVHHSSLYDGWFVFGYDDVVRVCVDNETFSAAPLHSTGPRGLFTLDEPKHAELRRRVSAAWLAAASDTQTFVGRSIDRTLEAIGKRPCFDLVDDLARPLPRDVYYDILGGQGIDTSERLVLDALARSVTKHHDHTLDALQRWDGTLAGLELAARLTWMLAKASRPHSRYAGSFLAHLARSVDWRGGLLSPAVAVLTLVNLNVAGYLSVEFLLATGIRRLLLDSATGWNTVTTDPSALPFFLQEMRRTEHALSVIDRFAKHDVELSHVRIPAGARVYGVLASANRDERIYGPDADNFDPYRRLPKPHLGLGYGTHECMGRVLENYITDPAIRRFVAQWPDLHLQSDAQPPWFENFYFRSFDHLAVTIR